MGAENELDYVHVSKQAKMVTSLPRLGWIDASSVAAGHVAAPFRSISAAAAAAAFADWDAAAMRPALALSELLAGFELGFLGRCADAQASLGVLDKVYEDEADFLDALELALARMPSPSPFEFGPNDLQERTTFLQGGTPAVVGVAAQAAVPPVAAVAAVRANRALGVVGVRAVRARPGVPGVAAVAAVAAVPATGPADLVWFHMVQVGHRVQAEASFPLREFLLLGAIMLDAQNVAARADPTSRVRSVVGALRLHLEESVGSSAQDAALARRFRRFGDRIATLPKELRAGSFDADAREIELTDDIAYGGDTAAQDGVTLGRLEHVKAAYPILHTLLAKCGSRASKMSVLSKLSAVLTEAQQKFSLFYRLEPLDGFLSNHSAFLTQCWNKNLPLDGADGVISLLLRNKEEWEDTDKGGEVSQLEGASGDGASGARGLSSAALRRALIEDAAFVDAAEDIARVDISTEDGREEAVELACLSKCVVFQRFFGKPEAWMQRHAVFGILFKCLDALPRYFGKAQAAGDTGVIDPLQEDWTYVSAQCTLAFRGSFTTLCILGDDATPYGALALYNLASSEPFQAVPPEQRYIVDSVLEIMSLFAHATMIAAGWAASSSEGYTLAGLFKKQREHVKWCLAQGEVELATLLPHARANFENALQLAQEHVVRQLADPEPASVTLGCVLPFGSEFDKAMDRKTKGAAPLVTVRRAFPNLLPSSSPRSLPGVVLTSPGKTGGGGGGGGLSTGAGLGAGKGLGAVKAPGDGADRLKPKGQPGAPGSKKTLVSWDDDGHMRLGPYVYDVAAISKLYGLAVNKTCWPVLLTNKKGGEALCLCDKWGTDGHTSLTSTAHQRPQKWNINTIEKQCAVKAAGVGDKRKKPAT